MAAVSAAVPAVPPSALIGDALRIVYEVQEAGEQPARVSRRALAARSLQPGEVVAEAPALAAAPHGDLAGRRCDFCLARGNDDKGLQRCGRCRSSYYCNRVCQEAAWVAHHKVECKASPNLQEALVAEGLLGVGAMNDALLAGRCLRGAAEVSAEAGGSSSSTSTGSTKGAASKATPSASGVVDDLEALGDERVGAGELERLRRLARAVAGVPKLLPAGTDAQDALSTLRRFRNNNFAVVDDLFVSVGAGVFPHGASLNHSCAPNCLLTYRLQDGRPPVQVVRAMVAIEEGTELTHSYVELAFPAWQRRALLQEGYGFDCACTLCGGDSRRAALDAMLVGDAAGQGAVAKPEDNCPLPAAPECCERDEDLAKAAQLFTKAAAEEDARLELQLLEEVCDLRERWLHRRHLEVTAAHAAAHTAAIAAGEWTAAERHCGRLVELYLEVYPRWHPITGLQMYTLAELKERRGALAEARGWYRRSLAVLRLTHGENHPMVQDLRDHLAEIADS